MLKKNILLVRKVLFLAVLILFSTSLSSFAASQALEKIDVPQLYQYQIEEYVESKFKWDVPKSGVSNEEIRITAKKAGWNAFNQNFGIYGASATIIEECLGTVFLNSTNSALSEVGGVLVLMQLIIDLSQKDYKAANINFGKGTIGYVIGKWGTKAMKIGTVGATAVELFLGTVANKLNREHDDAYYSALRRYFTKWTTGTRKIGEWLKIFNASKIDTPDDILKIIHAYVEERMNSEDFLNFLAGEKDSWESGVAVKSGRYDEYKDHFKDYVTQVVILSNLQPLFKRLNENNLKRRANTIIKKLKGVAKELNREYTIDGKVTGPKDKIGNLQVKIPGFLETRTNSSGRFKFRFTLYSLLKSSIILPSRIELWIPEKDRRSYIMYAKKNFKIKNKHRETGIIKGGFKLPLLDVQEDLSEKPNLTGAFYDCVRKACLGAGGQWITYKESEKLTKEVYETLIKPGIMNLSRKKQIEAAFHRGHDVTCFYGLPPLYRKYRDKKGCHFNTCKPNGVGFLKKGSAATGKCRVDAGLDVLEKLEEDSTQRY